VAGLLCGVLAFAAVSQAAEEVAVMESGVGVSLKGKPPIDRSTEIKPQEAEKFDGVGSFKQMKALIYKQEQAMMAKEMEKDGDGDEEVAIGDTLKSMEAKHAVEEELESEVATNCEVGEWSPYGKCSASCDGGKQERTREVMTQNQNGGAPCPVLSENIVCNSDSCASEAYKRRATRRKLTAAEHKKEGIMNRRQETLAMRSNSVFEMKKRTREVMRKLVHTELAVVQLPGEEGERTPEQQIRKSLQAAMAKNSVTDAMKTYEATKHAAADTTSQQSADNEQFKRATSKPTGNGNEKH